MLKICTWTDLQGLGVYRCEQFLDRYGNDKTS